MGKIKTILIIVVVFVAIWFIAWINSFKDISITVKEKDRITTGSGEAINSKFIIYTDKEVFENTDELFFGKFNSADFQNTFTVGKTYKVKVVSWRVPFLSMYRNIVKIY